MGRSVSTRDAIAAYYDVSEHGYGWDEENNCVDYDPLLSVASRGRMGFLQGLFD